MQKAMKYARWVVLGGVLLQFGGCFNTLWQALPAYLLTELLLDFNGIIDIFPDPG